MEDLRRKPDENLLKKINNFYLRNKIYVRNILIFSLLYLILFKPYQTALVISNWINSFIGTLINHINI